MRQIERAGAFKRQYKLMLKRGKSEEKMRAVIALLAEDKPLPAACRDHALTGKLAAFRDCHIEPDWLLLYAKRRDDAGVNIPALEATGTHSDLF